MYLNLRDLFPQSILLESSEVDDQNYAHSILCAQAIAGISFKDGLLKMKEGEGIESRPLAEGERLQDAIKSFVTSFESSESSSAINGFFGFQCFEAVRYFETEKAGLCPSLDEICPSWTIDFTDMSSASIISMGN